MDFGMGEAAAALRAELRRPVAGHALRATEQVLTMHLSQALSGAMQAGYAAEAVTMRSDEHRDRLLALRGKAHRV